MPSSNNANGSKLDKLPTTDLLNKSKDRIINWWSEINSYNTIQRDRFFLEAECSLPLTTRNCSVEDVFSGLEIQRSRLKQLQQIQDWPGLS
jgi:hypothetical protein